jgi:cytochrome c oxidase assembly factor CtaG
VLLLTLALVSPLDAIGEEYLLSAHMLQHVLIGDAAPALMLVALRGPLLFFFLPAAALAALARSGVARSFFRFVARPVVALSVWATVIAVWHVPALYDYTLSHQLVHDLEHVSFVVAGLLVWYQLVDPARKGVLTRGGRVGFAVLLFAAGQVLSMVLLFSFEPLYPAYAAQPERLLGISALTDQRLAGLVMMFEQAVTLGTCAAFLLLSADQQARAAEEKAALLPEPRS